MISGSDALKSHVVDLETRQAETSKELSATEEHLSEITKKQRQIAPVAFSNDKEATREFERLEQEAAKFSTRAKALGFKLDDLGEQLIDSRRRLKEAERRERIEQLEASTTRLKEIGTKAGKKIDEYASLIDEAKRVDAEISAVCRQLGIEPESQRFEILIESQLANTLRRQFPRIPWGRQVCEIVDFEGLFSHLLKKAKACEMPPTDGHEDKAEDTVSKSAKARTWVPLESL